MLEILMIIAATSGMAKAASIENMNSFAWGGITLALCIASLFVIPLPFIRIVVVTVLMFITWIAYRIATRKRGRR